LETAHEKRAHLPGARRARHRLFRFEAHIAACAHCSLYLEQLRQTIALTGTLREEDVQPDARRALLEQFGKWKQERA